jgi:UDP-N-acetylglucosamine acyltransferase
MATFIHPTAIVENGAELDSNCHIGPFCYVGKNVQIGAGTILYANVVIDGYTSIGKENEVFSFACLGMKTQDLKYSGGKCYVKIGNHNTIREYVTIHAATGDGEETVVGDGCLIQAYCHVAHNCILGNKVIMSSGAKISGHVEVGDCAVISGMVGVVQFVHIGKMAFIGGFSKLSKDALPYCITDGIPASTVAPNRVGMERHGKTQESIKAVEKALRVIMKSHLVLNEALAMLENDPVLYPEVKEIIGFARNSRCGLARPREKEIEMAQMEK